MKVFNLDMKFALLLLISVTGMWAQTESKEPISILAFSAGCALVVTYADYFSRDIPSRC